MTFIVDGNDIGQVIEIALTVISIVGVVIGAFLVWMMVRPPRHVRNRKRRGPQVREVREADGIELEEMMRLLDRMDQRLAVLERAIGTEDEAPRRMTAGDRQDEFLNLGTESPDARRTK